MKQERIAHLLEMIDHHADTFARIPLANLEDTGETAVLLISSILGYKVVVLLIEDGINGPELLASKGIDNDDRSAWATREAFVKHLYGVIDSPSILECNSLDEASAGCAHRLGLGEIFLAVPLRGYPRNGENRVGLVVAAQPHNDYDPNVDIMAVEMIAGVLSGAISKCIAATNLLEIQEAMNTEINRRKRAEEALLELEEKYSTLVENPLIGIYIDQNGKIAFANSRFAEMFGYARDELIGMESRMLVHPEDRALTDEIRAKRLKGEEVPSEYEARGLTKTGETIWVSRRNTQIEYRGRPAILGNIVDITESLAKETQLIQASKMSTLGEMAAGVAHELNQPLSTIQIGTDFFRSMVKQGQKIPDDELALVSEQMAEQVKRAVRIINHLREFGRKTEIQRERVDINRPLNGVFVLLSEQLKLRGIKVVLDLKDDLPPIMGDSIRLEQVFIDVVVNARDAMEEKKERSAGGSPENTLTIRSFHEGGRVVVTISDTGTGIPDEIKDKIFERFFTTKGVGKGTGLGLSISYGIVKEYEGTIEVESGVGKGTTFKITFPACSK
jgi:PAS domain S-box-containing protein